VQFTTATPEPAGFGLAPLLDVVLLLLIFFVVTTSFTEPRMTLELPAAETGVVEGREELIVSLSAAGVASIGGEPVGEAVLEARLAEAARADHELALRADQATPHGAVVGLLDRARVAGIERIAIAVQPAGPRAD
jgi:biopolymer transport protein ExbD